MESEVWRAGGLAKRLKMQEDENTGLKPSDTKRRRLPTFASA
jgi:hypothetical protein